MMNSSRAKIQRSDVERHVAFVDVADLALGTRHGDDLAVAEQFGATFGAHDRGNAQFAADDRRVARPPAAVGDDGGRPLHDGLPVGVRLVDDEDVAALHLLEELSARDDPHGPLGDRIAHGVAANKGRCRGL